MNSNINTKTGVLDKALDLINFKRKRNYKCRIHDEARDFFIENLHLIKKGLIFLDKELRIVGGAIDIVAKENNVFYFIEVKTALSKHTKPGMGCGQLLQQKEGLQHIVSMFTDKRPNIKLMLVEYIRDIRKVLVKSVNDSGKVVNVREFFLKGD